MNSFGLIKLNENVVGNFNNLSFDNLNKNVYGSCQINFDESLIKSNFTHESFRSNKTQILPFDLCLNDGTVIKNVWLTEQLINNSLKFEAEEFVKV